MTETPELDRAIEEAQKIVKVTSEEPGLSAPYGSIENSRTYVRALIAELLRGMEEDLNDPVTSLAAIVYRSSFNDVLAEIRRRAGLEGEG